VGGCLAISLCFYSLNQTLPHHALFVLFFMICVHSVIQTQRIENQSKPGRCGWTIVFVAREKKNTVFGLRNIILVHVGSVSGKCVKIHYSPENKGPFTLKGVHFEINFLNVLAYLKGIQYVGVCFRSIVSILIFLGRVCQSYYGGLWSPPQRACTEKSKLNMI